MVEKVGEAARVLLKSETGATVRDLGLADGPVFALSADGARLLSVQLKHYVAAHGASAKDGHPEIARVFQEVGGAVVVVGHALACPAAHFRLTAAALTETI